MPMINENLLEQKFIQEIETWDFTNEVSELTQSEAAATIEDHSESIHQLDQELKKIEKRRAKWQYAWADEEMSYVDYKQRMKEEEEKEKMLQKELKNLTPKEAPTQYHNNIELWTNLKLNWQNMTNETKKQFILIAVKSIVVDKINSGKNVDSIAIKDLKLN